MIKKNNSMKQLLFIAVLSCLWLTASCNSDFNYTPKQFVAPTLSVPLINSDSIRNFLGAPSNSFKLAFTNASDQALYIVDFSQNEVDPTTGEQHPSVVKLPRDPARPGWNFDSPLLSPDGKLVTYYLRSGATQQAPYVQDVSGATAAISVASVGTDPHFWVDSTGELFIIYSDKNLTQINMLSSLSGSSTFQQKIDPSTGALIGSRTVLFNKPFNGGLSKNGRYLCTGYADGAFYDFVDNKLSYVYHKNSYLDSGGLQICNPSINPTTDTAHQSEMLFLPFNGVPPISYAPGWAQLPLIGMHEYLFIADKTNTALWYLKMPAGYFEWQCPEWTNDSNFVVAIAKITEPVTDDRYDCFLIKRSDNKILKLTNSDFKMDVTSTPSLWISRQE
jgi:hypothetical protein